MTRKGVTIPLALLICPFLGGSCSRLEERGGVTAERPPNVVIIFADDLGYGDLGCYGHPTIRTPHIDRMAAEGQKWTNFYAEARVCSPSRAALLTGRMHVRSGMYGKESAVFFPDSPTGIPADEITLAEALKQQGYATGIVGKWHLGDAPEYLPNAHGFDYWLGLPYSNDMNMVVPRDRGFQTEAYYQPKSEYWDVPLMRNGEIVERPVNQATLTKRYTEEALRFIKENKESPFFLYVPHTMPHIPLFRSEEFVGKSMGGIYGDVIEEIDWSVGRILDALLGEGLAENTLVVLSSDNGPWLTFGKHGGSPGPLRDGKGTTWEGGMRVPGIFWWPGTIKPGIVMDMGSTLDVFATALELAGAAAPSDRTMDGLDLRPVLFGTGPSPRDVMFYYRWDELYAVRKGMFKAHFITQGAFDDGVPRVVHDPPLLYHLGDDPGERFNVAEQYPDVLSEIVALAKAHRETMEIGEPLFDGRVQE
ncbi:MAG: sulfatase [Acidobacteriota bacterium]